MNKILFRVEGGRRDQMGTGHLRRAIQVAHAMGNGFQIRFLCNRDSMTRQILKKTYPVSLFDRGKNREALGRSIKRYRPNMIIFDKLNNSIHELKMASASGARVVTFDDQSRGAARWSGLRIDSIFPTKRSHLGGHRYLVLPHRVNEKLSVSPKCRRILISFGGHDPHRLLPYVLRILLSPEMRKTGFKGRITCIAGTQYKKDRELLDLVESHKSRVRLHIETRQFGRFLAESDIAIVSGGLTLFQALQEGIPSIVLSQYSHQDITAQRLQKEKALIFLGRGRQCPANALIASVKALLENKESRRKIALRGRRLVDGCGLERVRDALLSQLKNGTEHAGARA